MDTNTLFIEARQEQIIQHAEQQRLLEEARAALSNNHQPPIYAPLMKKAGALLEQIGQGIQRRYDDTIAAPQPIRFTR